MPRCWANIRLPNPAIDVNPETSTALPVLADTVRLKDGSVIRGQIVSFKNEQFTILVGTGGLVPYPVDVDPFGREVYRNVEIRVNPQLLEELAGATGGASYVATDKVDLLVHSMGGLVTRVYVEGEGLEVSGQKIPYGGDIRKIIFSATPHRGFMEDYKTYEGGRWSDFLYNMPPLDLGMNGLLWPAFILPVLAGFTILLVFRGDPVRGVDDDELIRGRVQGNQTRIGRHVDRISRNDGAVADGV